MIENLELHRMPTDYPRSMDRLQLQRIGRSSRTRLTVGQTEVLFIDDTPWAVFDGNEVTFPDVPYVERDGDKRTGRPAMTAASQRAINEFWRDYPHIRESATNFDYQLARALMSQLRPLTRTEEK